jgi:hypothetical protein
VNDPQINCSNCGTEIKLTESLAAPLIAAARKQFEAQLGAKEADFGRREARLQQTQADLAKAREAIDEQVAAMLKAERAGIAENEARKARLALADDLVERDRRLLGKALFAHFWGQRSAIGTLVQDDFYDQISDDILECRADEPGVRSVAGVGHGPPCTSCDWHRKAADCRCRMKTAPISTSGRRAGQRR